jgi:hypothetical protein
MSGHDFGSVLPLVLVAIFVISAVRRQLRRLNNPPAFADRTATRSPIVSPPPPAPAPPRRRLASPPLAWPATPRPLPTTPRPAPAAAELAALPPMPELLTAEDAFPSFDFSLPGTVRPAAVTAARRRLRSIGGGPAPGSPGWGANAVLALEVLGPPVSLRSGATLGAPHAF